MSILETLASLATAKTVAAAAATTLAVGGATGLSIANSAVEESPADVEVPVSEEADNRAENADLGAGNADGRVDTEEELDTEVEATDADTQDVPENEGRADAVHEALLGDGDPDDFGQSVAENARNSEGGEFGRTVADAASQGASADGRARADEARSQRDDAEVTEDETASDHGQRPEDTPAEGEGSASRVDGEETATNNREADRPGSAGSAGRP
jgi:hypothetical protein